MVLLAILQPSSHELTRGQSPCEMLTRGQSLCADDKRKK